MNSQSVLEVQGILGWPTSSFMVVRALLMIGSEGEDKVIFSAKVASMVWMW